MTFIGRHRQKSEHLPSEKIHPETKEAEDTMDPEPPRGHAMQVAKEAACVREGNDGKGSTAKKMRAKRPLRDLLFRYSTMQDVVMMLIGTIAAIMSGLVIPAFIVLFGAILDDLNGGDVLDSVRPLVFGFVTAGVAGFVSGTIMIAMWNSTGERIALRIKQDYIRSILRQDIGWFDEHPAGELPGVVTAAMGDIQDGIGRKVADLVDNFMSFAGSFATAFILAPKLAGVLLACIPFTITATWAIVRMSSRARTMGSQQYRDAGRVANEVLSAVRTVASLTTEEHELARYGSFLITAEKAGIRLALQEGLGNAVLLGSAALTLALAFWYGTKLVADDIRNECQSNCITGGDVIATVFGILLGGVSLGQTSPGFTAIGKASEASSTVCETLDRVPEIDSANLDGEKPNVKGRLELRQVGFSYPARPEDLVFESVSLNVSPGETLALVGPSGSGKSTITKLLLRFYDPTSGSLLLDGHDVRTLNVTYFRSKIGYVGQEPVLFSGSIRENVALGKPGASDEEIIWATKAANAHEFIESFPQKYSTDVGSNGLQLSGGQKQRIAIARAIIKDPAILLLDEATSALDSESEEVVQRALDRLKRISNYTTVVIAHRLSTIKDADRIAVIANKGIPELGTHAELTSLNGIYASLCAAQASNDGSQSDDTSLMVDSRETTGELRSARQSSKMSHGQASMLGGASEGAINDRDSNDGDRESESKRVHEEQVYPEPPMSRMWALNRPEMGYIVLGCFGAALAGAFYPVEGVIIAHVQSNLYGFDADEIERTGDKWVLAFVGLSALAVIGFASLSYGFGVAGERLTRRLREIAFKSILRHDIGWFDRRENSAAVLTISLEEDTTKVKMATGTDLGRITQMTVTLVSGMLIGVIYAWQIGLLAIALVPLMALAGIIQMRMRTGSYGDSGGLDGGANAGLILGGALNGVTTITAFNMQEETARMYERAVEVTIKGRLRRGYMSAVATGYGQGIMFWVYAVVLYVGAVLVDNGTLKFLDFFTSFFAVAFGAYGVGKVKMDVGAKDAALKAAGRIFRLEDEALHIDPLSEQGAKGASEGCAISFRQVKFAYPQRPDAQVLGSDRFPLGFDLKIDSGETVALVGPSGSGKSTCLQLLLRFYDALEGDVLLDGRSIEELNVRWLRQQMGYVGQEPVLFAGTIRENIERGKPGATLAEIEAAARSAFAHEFIVSFQDGYDTDVGEKSSLLSGGQKQRIAIARAIVSDPPILLLDEATSALDNESERQVQAALDNLQKEKRRTTLVIAHRLTTIRNADKIAVIAQGGVVELGSHQELMQISGGMYSNLYRQQTDKFNQGIGVLPPKGPS